MEDQKKYTHWKKLANPNYIGSYDFQPGEERVVEIVEVKRELVVGNEGKKEECTIVHLKNQKPMILNATNGKMITKILGTPNIYEWPGKKIILIVQTIRVAGEPVEAIRVKNQAPTKPKLQKGTKAWENVVASLKNKSASIDKVLEFYDIAAPDLNELKGIES